MLFPNTRYLPEMFAAKKSIFSSEKSQLSSALVKAKHARSDISKTEQSASPLGGFKSLVVRQGDILPFPT
jgi:hypothetical protein